MGPLVAIEAPFARKAILSKPSYTPQAIVLVVLPKPSTKPTIPLIRRSQRLLKATKA